MLKAEAQLERSAKTVKLESDLVVVGGGMAGTCCAITAAREGLKVTLIQDRPVLGGNASSEIRLWILGATSHQGNNNRWAREGGVIDEILVENMFRNPEGNAVVFDSLVLEKVHDEENITLLLNTVVFEVHKGDADTIQSVRAFCSQNGTMYIASAPLFCDASGDGVVGFMAGAAFRMGAESREEFGEKLAPTKGYGELLGHSMYFYSKDTGHPVHFVPPSFALDDITKIPRYRRFNTREHGCELWWIEYGGRLDTVHDTESIKWELWKVIYGVWNHIKNSGNFPEAKNLTLEWVGTIPGKRESRRFEGDGMITQQDIVEQRRWDDAVSYGGWAIDLHPADGIFSEKPACNQYHSKGVYQIPYRTMYSRNISNLFLAGRIISASHVAFGSTRVMATCAHNAQAVAMAAAMCREQRMLPREIAHRPHITELQRRLIRRGQFIPHVSPVDNANLAASARIKASSELTIATLRPSRKSIALEHAMAMIIPVMAGRVPAMTFWADADERTELVVELRASSQLGNYTPDAVLARTTLHVNAPVAPIISTISAARSRMPVGRVAASDMETNATVAIDGSSARRSVELQSHQLKVDFDVTIPEDQYLFVCFMANPAVSIRLSDQRITGLMSLAAMGNGKVAESHVQQPPEDIGIDAFEFWLPRRRPKGQNIAMSFDPPLRGFDAGNVVRSPSRPTTRPNAWIADFDDPQPTIELSWDQPMTIQRIELDFDTDFDHAMESVLLGHPERVMPFCVGSYRIKDETGRVLAFRTRNHQTRNVLILPHPVTVERLSIEIDHPSNATPAALLGVRIAALAMGS